MRYLELDGTPVVGTVGRLVPLTYGHFTAMQVRDRAVAGWALHLARLAASSLEVFGAAVPDEQVHELVVRALTASGRTDASMRVMMVPPAGGLPEPGIAVVPDVLVAVADPVDQRPVPAMRVCSQVYERELPHVKHLATMGLTRAHRRAVEDGYDDAVFVDRDGLVLEGSIYNIAFFDGDTVVWPDAPMLTGITMHLMRQALDKAGVAQRSELVRIEDLPSFSAAFFTNSTCARQPVLSVDDVVFPGDVRLTGFLDAAWATLTWDRL